MPMQDLACTFKLVMLVEEWEGSRKMKLITWSDQFLQFINHH